MTPSPDPAPSSPPRIASLDQFRGYTVAGMLVVNYLGGFDATPPILDHHNTYCSYADTIMPQFFFAVGYAFRLTYLKRSSGAGGSTACKHALGRIFGLLLLGILYHGLDGRAENWQALKDLGYLGFLRQAFQREPFQTLTSIALASLWCLPVIGRSSRVIAAFAVFSAALHLALSRWFYFDWAWTRPVIDGGPLGFLSWSLPLLSGALAHDLLSVRGPKRSLSILLLSALVLMSSGYLLSCLGGSQAPDGSPTPGWAAPPFTAPTIPVNLWTMSQRTGSVSYLIFSSGVSLAILALFVVACDLLHLQVGLFRTFGRNALVAYILHSLVWGPIRQYAPSDSPLWWALSMSGLAFAITYLFIRHLEKDGVFVRI